MLAKLAKEVDRNSQSMYKAHKGKNERRERMRDAVEQAKQGSTQNTRGRFWVTVRAVTRTKGRCWNALIASAPSLSLSHTHTASHVPASICSGNTPFSPRETQETLKPRENAISPRCSRITPPSPGATLSSELLFPRFSSRISSCTLTRSFVFYFGVIHIDFSLQTLDVTFLVFFIFFFISSWKQLGIRSIGKSIQSRTKSYG